ncbi:CHAD domain-containing protein [Sphingomonas sp. RB56-2]|uniref:CHAD domain-containing protein n=1 Tax=Sphingomonas brevis TaxID=2908206 RepID=A0ABT0S804_9SPHN|nr:CYTH and CHAD domain-containing protein [Sphingomonas brevis]MCL6740546.1 CHAD domain-containing protein [Sphingomonas brevis]
MAKAKDHRETELKFDLDRQAARKVRRHPLLADRAPTTQSQTSVYFDTGKRRIGKAGYSLRVRQSGGGHVQTVKSTGGGAGLFDRAEWEVPVESLEVDAKALKSTPLRKLKRLDRKLEPQVRSTVERATWLIDRDGSLIEVVLDEGMVEAGDETAKFQELEMELRHGAQAGLFGFAKQLAEDIPLEIGVLSKEERGLLLAERALDHEQKAREPAICEEMSIGQAFVATVQECVRHFRLNQALIIAERDAAALHQARVAMRRLRTAFTLFGPVIREGSLEPLKCELRAFIEPFGVARNLDVYLDKHGEELGWRDQRVLRSARSESYDQVVEALNSQQKRDMLVDLVEWTASADWQQTGASRPIAKFARRRLDDAWNKVKRGGSQPGKLDEHQLHRLRINIKKLRYSAEFLAPLYRKKQVRAFVTSLERMQDCLGLIHDDMISREIIATYELAESGRTDIAERARQLAKLGGRFKRLKQAGRFWR